MHPYNLITSKTERSAFTIMKTMSRLQELIQHLCPNGVEYKQLWEVTIWDKKFNGVDRNKQPKVISYPYLLAKDMKALEQEDGDVTLLSTGEYVGHTTEELAGSYLCEGEIVTLPWGGTVKGMKYFKGKFVTADNRIATSADTRVLNNKFLYYIFLRQADVIQSFYRGAGIQHPNMNDVLHMLIPVPPIEVQEEVVRILDTFSAHAAELQAELQARKEQYDYYRNLLLTFSPSACGYGTDGEQELGLTTPPTSSYKITWKTMGEIFVMKAGKAIPSSEIKDYNPGDYCACFGANGLRGYVPKANKQTNNIIIGRQGALCGNISYAKGPYYATDHAVVIENSPVFDNRFLFHLLVNANLNQYKTSGAQPGLSVEILKNIVIPVPPLDLQLRIASILDRFETLVNDLTQGLPAEIAACRERYEYFRNKLLTFKKIA